MLGWMSFGVVLVVGMVGCGSSDHRPVDIDAPPLDCTMGVPSAELIAGPQASTEEMRDQLPVMLELFEDVASLRSGFGVDPGVLMIDGAPRLLVGVDDAAGRCDGMQAAIARPDLLVLVDWSERDYSAAFDLGMPPWRRLIEVDIGYPDRGVDQLWTSIGTGAAGLIGVGLRPDQEELAVTLLERYGDLVEVSVGNFPYGVEVEPASEICGDLPDGMWPDEVSVKSMSLDGDLFTGRIEVVVGNDGSTPLHLVPARFAELTEPGSIELVSMFGGEHSAERRGSLGIEPGAELTITAIPSTASCDPDRGYSLPAGTYEFVLPVYVFDSEAWEGDVSDRVLLPRLSIELD